MFSLAPAALPYPNVNPVLLHLGPLQVRWYGLAYVVGFIAAGWVMYWLGNRWKLGLSVDDVTEIMLGAVIGVVVGGRVGYMLIYTNGEVFRDPLSVLRIWTGGMSFHGGLVGILIAAAVVARLKKIPFLTLCDIGAVGTPIGLFLGRVANFINGELWGRTTTAPWGVVFPGAGPLPRHPSQLYEAALEGVVLLVILLVLAMKEPPRPRGEILGWMLTLYGVFRIFVEFFRQPDVQIGFLPGGITTGQLLSIPVLLGGIALVVWARRRGLPEAGKTLSDG